ncbi:hypothetical protein PAXINDRAFT_171199 [Paxillus involutus ATCC 200175]|uniref:Uncharacterized protein n=1 Tax=Paxillus involutus ATCC 200175 TaxID=664439 RepID=A0A0C9TYL2_PAXIN|nr:hypothetical protein PAXINDRAFT_171199 [Paxillus involutus ATCC 200175]
MNTQSTASLLSSFKQSQPQKDYSAAFGDLQSRYGMGVHVPCIPQSPAPSAPTTSNSKKWYKWRSSQSSSATPVVSTPSCTLHAHPRKGVRGASRPVDGSVRTW